MGKARLSGDTLQSTFVAATTQERRKQMKEQMDALNGEPKPQTDYLVKYLTTRRMETPRQSISHTTVFAILPQKDICDGHPYVRTRTESENHNRV